VELMKLRRDTNPGTISAVEESALLRQREPTPLPRSATRLSHRSWTFLIAAAIVVAGGLVLYNFAGGHKPAPPFQTMSIERSTSAGEVRQAAVSPDGKYVAFTLGDEGKRSLWVRQVATHRDIQLIKPGSSVSCCLSVSPDANYIYFVGHEAASETSQLFQVATLGGDSRKMAAAVATRVGFAPDGKRFAFVRETTSAVTAMMVASIEGGEQQQLAERKVPDPFAIGGAAWSPDGKWIASGAYSNGRCFVVVVPAGGGQVRQIGSEGWLHVGRVSWLGDSSGLVVTAQESASAPWPIWEISYPDGRMRRITNDLNDYEDVSLTADSQMLVAVEGELQSNLWTAPEGATDRATQISSGAGTQDGYFGLNWTPDGHILYASRASGTRELWLTDVTGADRRQLTWDANLTFFSSPVVCPDGSAIVYASGIFGDANLWRFDLDGGKRVQLTREGTNGVPSCSPDGKWVVFNAWRGGELMLWKIPAYGGVAEQLTNYPSAYPVVSPDGKWIAFENESYPGRNYLSVIPFAGGPPARSFDNSYSYPAGHPVFRWSLGSRALDYIDTRAGVSNIWRQPLGGGPPHQVTHFPSGQLFNFAWSPDGRELAVARGSSTSDAVLIRNFGAEARSDRALR